MKFKVKLGKDDLTAIVRAAFEYNGFTPESVEFLDGDGRAVDIQAVEIVCDGRGLRLRIQPEELCTPEQLAKHFSALNVGSL